MNGQYNFGPGGRNAWDWLDDAVINSRGFVQPSEFLHHPHHLPQTTPTTTFTAAAAAVAGGGSHKKQKGDGGGGGGGESRSAIWHWHGYKANQIRCHFDRILDGSWDVSGE